MNYLRHFGLREPPFGITPDTSFFYACSSIQDALNTLLVAVGNGEGFIKVTGEVGTGKTLLCRKFLGSLDDGWVSLYIPNPALDPKTLLLALAEELGVRPGTGDQHLLIKSINHALLDLARSKKRVVVCLDEAQAMPIESMETLRLLTNLETEKRKLLQVILFGQPELDHKLADPTIRQLRQRITFHHHMGTFTRAETAHYLAHRMRVAGHPDGAVFSPAAARTLHTAARGTPRLVNILANKSLMLAFGEGTTAVRRSHVGAAVADTPAVSAVRAERWIALGVGLACAVAGIGWMLVR